MSLSLLAGIFAAATVLSVWLTRNSGQPALSKAREPVASLKPAAAAAETKTPEKTDLAIPTDEAKYLQDVEHLGGFVVGDKAFPQIARSLRDRDVDAVSEYFNRDFQGAVFDANSGQTADYSFAHLHKWQEDRDRLVACDRERFVRELFKYRNELGEVQTAQLKVLLMSPVAPGQLSGPWKGTCKLRLAGLDREGRPSERVVRFHCLLSDISDETPKKRGWILECKAYAAAYARSPQALMRDMTADTGIDVKALWDNWTREHSGPIPVLTGGVYLADYNQDGYMDVLITDLTGNRLYQGRAGAKFVEVTDEVRLPRRSFPGPTSDGACFADFDGDGFEDLIVAHRIFRNDQGRRFVELVPGKDTSLQLDEDAHQYAVADYDRDGRLDLYLIGLPSQDPSQRPARSWINTKDGMRNQLWRNLGNWQFQDVTAESGTMGNGIQAFAAVWFDANGDDWPDLMTSCEIGADDYLINQGDGSFRKGALPPGYGGMTMGITVGDIDNDGYGDPYLANMFSTAGTRIVANLRPDLYPPEVDAQIRDFVSGNELYRNRGDGTFERVAKKAGVSDVGWAYGAGYVDLNGDGLLDIYCPAGFQSVNREKPDG